MNPHWLEPFFDPIATALGVAIVELFKVQKNPEFVQDLGSCV
jgi:hypothetical protein